MRYPVRMHELRGRVPAFRKEGEKMADVLRPKDLMKILGVCRAKAYQLIQEPGFPAHKIGPKEVIIYPKELEEWRRNNFVQTRPKKVEIEKPAPPPQPVCKTLIAIPCFDMVHTDFMKSLVEMDKPEGTTFAVVKNTLIYNARNAIVDNAIRLGFDRVLWLDSDIVFPSDLLLRLGGDMDRSKAEFISGIYFQRVLPTKPVIYSSVTWKVREGVVEAGAENYLEYPKNRIFEIAGAGFGCVLTDVSLLKRMKDKYGAPFTPMIGISEDLAFCWRVNQSGGKMYCDPSIRIGHIGQIEINESSYHRPK